MKKKWLKRFALMFFMVLMFAGCEGAKSGPGKKGKLVVKMLYPDNSTYPYQKDWLVLREIEKATGVDLQLILVPDISSDYESKKQIVFNSGKIPEIVYSKYEARTEDVQSGILLPISDYVDQMPHFSRFLKEYQYAADMDNLREADGKYYTLPVKADTRRMRIHQWLARVDIFEKHNLPLPQTLPDVYQAGLRLKELYPDSDPIINRFGSGNILSLLGSGFGTLAGWGLSTTHAHIYDQARDEWIFAPASDNFKEMLMYLNKLLTSGVLDEEFTTLDSTAYEQRVILGETFILIDWVGNQVRYNLEGKKLNPDFNVQPIFPIKGKNGDYALERGALYEQYWVIPASVKKHARFPEILKFIDWFYSEEAAIITTFGVEGESYKIENDRLVYLDLSKEPSRTYGLLNNALNVRRHPDFFFAMNGKEVADLFDQITEAKAIRAPEPKVRYNAQEVENLKLIAPPVIDYKNSMVEKFIYGKIPFSDWQTFVNECEKKGSQRIGALVNGAWKREN